MGKTAASDQLFSVNQRMVEAWKSGDTTSMVDILADDVVLMPPNDPAIYGKDEAREWFREYFQHFRVVGLAESDRDVTIFDGWAIERFSYQVAIQPIAGGDRILDEGRFLVVSKQDAAGEWRIAQEIWNSSRPIGTGASRFMALRRQRLNARSRPE